MLSMQIDRLRSCADLYDGTTKPEMAKELQRPYLAHELREAADTIWQLRDDLQRANAENAKLRELVRDMFGGYKGAVEMMPSCYSKSVMEMAVMDISDRMRELGVEEQ